MLALLGASQSNSSILVTLALLLAGDCSGCFENYIKDGLALRYEFRFIPFTSITYHQGHDMIAL
jgi:hypothetical protein